MTGAEEASCKPHPSPSVRSKRARQICVGKCDNDAVPGLLTDSPPLSSKSLDGDGAAPRALRWRRHLVSKPWHTWKKDRQRWDCLSRKTICGRPLPTPRGLNILPTPHHPLLLPLTRTIGGSTCARAHALMPKCGMAMTPRLGQQGAYHRSKGERRDIREGSA